MVKTSQVIGNTPCYIDEATSQFSRVAGALRPPNRRRPVAIRALAAAAEAAFKFKNGTLYFLNCGS